MSWRVSLIGIGLALSSAIAADWPKGVILYEKSKSPDGHFGILVPSRETGLDEADHLRDGVYSGEIPDRDYLADLTKQEVLGKIRADYIKGENHRDFKVLWTPDSTWCLVECDNRYGFGSISILELKGARFTETDVGKHIQKALDGVIAKQSRGKETECYGSAYFRVREDRKLLVRAQGYTNPKSFEGVKTYHAFFEGTFNLNAKKWTAARARQISDEAQEGIEDAYIDYTEKDFIVIKDLAQEKEPEDFVGTTFSSEEDKAASLDQRMNRVYQTVRFAIPSSRFEKVKQEQITWLKQRDALISPEEKSKAMEARIKTLQDVLW